MIRSERNSDETPSFDLETEAKPTAATSNRLLNFTAFGFVWLYAAIVVLCSFAGEVNKFDDAIPLVHGMLIQQGKTPNLDFYSFYPPLSLYLVAASFTIFGKTVLALRVLEGLLYIVVLIMAARFFRAHFGASGLIAPLATLLLAGAIGIAIQAPFWLGVAFSLMALLVLLWSHEVRRGRQWLVCLAGVITGLAILSRINFGAYVALAVIVDLSLPVVYAGLRRDAVALRNGWQSLLIFVAALATTCGAIALSIYGAHLGTAVSEFIFISGRVMAIRGFHPLYVGGDLAYAVVLPSAWFLFRALQDSNRVDRKVAFAAVGILATLGLAFAGRNHYWIAPVVTIFELGIVLLFHNFVRPLKRAELTTLVFYCCLLHYFLSRTDSAHWRIIPIGWALLLPLLLYPGRERSETQSPAAQVNGTALAVLLLACFVFMVATDYRPRFQYLRPSLSLVSGLVRNRNLADSDLVPASDRPTGEWSAVYRELNEWQALRYLRKHSADTEPLFVGVREHAQVFWTDLRLYWLAGRPIASRAFQLETRVATEEPVQREIIDDLRKNRVRWMILDHTEDGDSTFFRANYRGSAILDQYIADHFTEEIKYGEYAVMRRTVD